MLCTLCLADLGVCAPYEPRFDWDLGEDVTPSGPVSLECLQFMWIHSSGAQTWDAPMLLISNYIREAARSSPWNNLPYVDALDIMDTLATDAAYYFDYPNEEEYAMAAAACYGINRYAPAGEEPTGPAGPALKQALDPQPYFGQCPPGEFISSISMATGNPLLVAKCSDGTVLSDGVGQLEENDLTEEVDLPQGFDKSQVLGNVEDPSSYNVDVPAGGTAWLAMIGRGFALDRRARWTGVYDWDTQNAFTKYINIQCQKDEVAVGLYGLMFNNISGWGRSALVQGTMGLICQTRELMAATTHWAL